MTAIRGPQNKFDFDYIERLSEDPPQAWEHLIPELLTWQQDVNWPIFGVVQTLLLRNPTGLIEPLRDVFRGEDEEWQFNTLSLVGEMSTEVRKLLKEDLFAFRRSIGDKVDNEWDMRERLDEVWPDLMSVGEKIGDHDQKTLTGA